MHRPNGSLSKRRRCASAKPRCNLRFHGRLTDDLVGFYRSTYTAEDGTTHTLATTQFEAPHARRAFPCFDEPEFKAVFSIALEVDDGLVALSNGPEVERTSLGTGRVRVQFADTIKMSTYLVAFIVGALECSPPVDVAGIPLRVVHVPGRGNLTAFATEVGAFALRFFDEYYDIPYPGEKLDLVALPDFAFGAMENLGCVTFRETALLVDPHSVTQAEAAQVALTIVHEIAHMWFGDLVTMKWWNGIWLNEAFATFMEHAGVDALHPEWRTWDDFAMARAAALDVDALSNTRAVEYEVRTPEDADGMFDVLTYQKGGSVVRMLEQWLGADAFRDGVRHYLDTYQLANTETTDLWDALEHATDRPARRIMDSWIFQPGYPEVSAQPVDGGVRITQRRFRYDRGDATERWSIPMLVRAAANDAAPTAVLLEQEATTIPSDGAAPRGPERRRRGLLPRRVSARVARAARRIGRPHRARALRPGRRRLGRGDRRHHGRGRVPRLRRDPARRDGRRRVALADGPAPQPDPPGRRRRARTASRPDRAN